MGLLSTSSHNNLDKKVSFMQHLELVAVDYFLCIVSIFTCKVGCSDYYFLWTEGQHNWFTKSNSKCTKRSRDVAGVLILTCVLTFGFCETKFSLHKAFSNLLHFQLLSLRLVFVVCSKKVIINERTIFSAFS